METPEGYEKAGALMIIPAVIGLAIGVVVGRASKDCDTSSPPLTQNAARTLLQTRDAIDRLEPVLQPMARGRTPSVRAVAEVLRG